MEETAATSATEPAGESNVAVAPTDGPGTIYYSKRQERRRSGMTSAEVNALEEKERKAGTLYSER